MAFLFLTDLIFFFKLKKILSPVFFFFSQLNTLRGSILEDAVPSTSKHGLARGLPLKEVLEYLVPELNVHCLRLALNTPKVTEQLMKLDEQGVRRHKKRCYCFNKKTVLLRLHTVIIIPHKYDIFSMTVIIL